MDADGNTNRYKDVYEFFKRVAVQSAEFDSLTKAARKFSTAFSGAVFAASERNHQHHLSDTEVKGAQGVTSATKPVPTGAVVPYQKWPRRTVAVMESVEEENDENTDPVNNFDPEDSEDDLEEMDSTATDKKLNDITASDKLGMACFRCVTKNSFTIPNCEYSHGRDIVAAARDKQMADLTETKRQMQAGHQANLKVFDKQGAKAVKLNVPQMRPMHTDTTPRLSLLGPSSGDIIDQHTGQEDACFKRIVLMTKNFPEDVLKKGCPNNYMREECFEQHEAYLTRYIIKELPERVPYS